MMTIRCIPAELVIAKKTSGAAIRSLLHPYVWQMFANQAAL